MSTYEKNIHYLKEAIFAKLNNDGTLQTLLGGSGKIFHRDIPQEPSYPCVIYLILSDTDHPYNEAQESGKVTETNFRIMIFVDNSTSEQSDNIESRIKSLLNGQNTLDTTKVICYSCYRDMLLEPFRDPDLQVWVTPIRYRITWATK